MSTDMAAISQRFFAEQPRAALLEEEEELSGTGLCFSAALFTSEV